MKKILTRIFAGFITGIAMVISIPLVIIYLYLILIFPKLMPPEW